jgi:prepilin-type N-terminal cleavage/methylation domain-containing protein
LKTSRNRRRAERGFTLLETVGVLAVIAIAAAVLPGMFHRVDTG